MRPKNHGVKSKYPYQPTLGVKADFERLLQNFSSAGTVRYEKFAEFWRDQNMASYCAGRQTKREAREYVEQCFHIATQFWLPPSSFLVRAGALYLLYGLYYYQLVLPKVKIRVTPEQWQTITEFQEEAREQQHLDLDFVFQKLLLDKAFQFVATPEEISLKQRGTDDNKIIPDSMKDDTSMLDEIFSSSALNQLSLVHDQYQKMKLALNGEDAEEPDTSLNIVHKDLISGIYKTLKTHKVRQAGLKSQNRDKHLENPDDGGDDDDDSSPSESQSNKKQLKQKAFEQITGSYREPGRGEKRGKRKDETIAQEDSRLKEGVSIVQPRHQVKKQKRGLYDKDEGENTPVQIPEVHEIFCMPDLDAIIPGPLIKTECTKSEDDTDEESCEEKEVASETTGRKGDTETDTEKKIKITEIYRNKEIETGDEFVDNNDDETKLGMENKERTDTVSGDKNLNATYTEKESTSNEGKEICGSTKANTVAATKDSKREGSVDTEPVDRMPEEMTKTEEHETKKKPGEKELTAQEKLQMKLNQRKKEARLKSAKDSKKGKKKS